MAQSVIGSLNAQAGGIDGTVGWDNGSKLAIVLANGNTAVARQALGSNTSIVVAEYGPSKTIVSSHTVTLTSPVNVGEIILAKAHGANNFWVIVRSQDRTTIRAVLVTQSTWTGGTWETVVAAVANHTYDSLDADVSLAGVVAVAYTDNTNSGTIAHARKIAIRNTGATWSSIQQSTATGALQKGYETAAIAVYDTSAGVTTMMSVFASSVAGADSGLVISLFKVTESTGALSGSFVSTTKAYPFSVTPANAVGRRLARVFRSDTSEFTIIAQSSQGATRILRGTFDGALAQTYQIDTTVDSGITPEENGPSFAITNSLNDSYAVHFVGTDFSGIGGKYIRTFPFMITNVSGTQTLVYVLPTSAGAYDFGLAGDIGRMGGNAANKPSDPVVTDHALVVDYSIQVSNGIWDQTTTLYWSAIPTYNATPVVTPANGSVITTANPQLKVQLDFQPPRGQSAYKAQFQFASDTGFTTNLNDYTQPDSKFKEIVDGPTAQIVDTLPGTFSLTGASTWYYRVRLIDQYGNVSAWTSTATVTLGHPPTPVLQNPITGQVVPWNGGSVTFQWNFTDPSPTDYQTAYAVTYSKPDGSSSVTTGKVVSANKSYTASGLLAATYKDTPLIWKAQLWDSQDTSGPIVTSGQFILTDPPAVTITSPTASQVLSTGVPTFQFTPSTGGSPVRTIQEYLINVTQGPNLIWSSRVQVNSASGTPISVKIPQGRLVNNSSYTVQVMVTDSAGLQATSSPVAFSTSWVSPATPTGVTIDTSPYSASGYVTIGWSDTGRDVDFTAWRVERKLDMIDENTGAVLIPGTFSPVFWQYSTNTSYTFNDYLAPSGYKATYRVVQTVNRLGQDIDSLPSSEVNGVPISDGYWVIQANVQAQTVSLMFKISIVNKDDFTDEQEESEYNIIGRGRHVDKGQNLGMKGTLSAQLRNTDGTNARYKRLMLLQIQETSGDLYLRNPFGDIFKVNVSQMQVSRIAGVGKSEFCDVQLPYAEVV